MTSYCVCNLWRKTRFSCTFCIRVNSLNIIFRKFSLSISQLSIKFTFNFFSYLLMPYSIFSHEFPYNPFLQKSKLLFSKMSIRLKKCYKRYKFKEKCAKVLSLYNWIKYKLVTLVTLVTLDLKQKNFFSFFSENCYK